MPSIDAQKRFDQWRSLLAAHHEEALIESLEEAPGVEVADFLAEQPEEALVHLFSSLDLKVQAQVFGHLHENKQLELYQELPRKITAQLFIQMPSDLRADFYQNLTERQQAKLLPYLPKEVRRDVLTLSAYPTEYAGSIMSTDFVTVQKEMTSEEALNQIREEAPSEKMVYYLYVVDDDMKMQGLVDLKKLVLAKPSTKVEELFEDTFIFAKVNEQKEEAAHKLEKYDLVVLPILNEEGQLVGIVSYDDALEVLRAEETGDMERFMGIIPDKHADDYLHTSSPHHFKRRIGWLAGLFLFSIVSGMVMHSYEKLLSELAILSLYITTINDAGGNAGSQTATVIIRALSLEQITFKDWFRILWKELQVAFMSVACLSLLAFGKVVLLSNLFGGHQMPLPTQGLYGLGLVIALALSLQVISATVIGAALPLFIHWLGKDPALAASPAITTIVDITGVVLYFGVAHMLLTPPSLSLL